MIKRKILILSTLAMISNVSQAAVATANATSNVIAAISITKVSDLAFGNGPPGDAAKVVAAGTVEDASNASFTVAGQASTAFTLTLPATINMVNGANTIAVNTFTSNAGTTPTIGAGGTFTLFVGATRAALGATQAVGAYTGTFTATVIY